MKTWKSTIVAIIFVAICSTLGAIWAYKESSVKFVEETVWMPQGVKLVGQVHLPISENPKVHTPLNDFKQVGGGDSITAYLNKEGGFITYEMPQEKINLVAEDPIIWRTKLPIASNFKKMESVGDGKVSIALEISWEKILVVTIGSAIMGTSFCFLCAMIYSLIVVLRRKKPEAIHAAT